MLKEQCVEMTFDNDGEWQEIKEQYEKRILFESYFNR